MTGPPGPQADDGPGGPGRGRVTDNARRLPTDPAGRHADRGTIVTGAARAGTTGTATASWWDGEGGPVADRACVKRRYRDEATAELALTRIREAGDAREKTPQRTYRCPRCRGWHLTSWPE